MKKILSILLVLIIVISCFALVACNKVADNTEHYTDITKKCSLTKSYEAKSFLSDGIGVATVSAFTDGDTTRFSTGDNTVIIRYYCIDTPESTGSVQKWGKAASNFVKERLSQATEIVLESSTGGRPEHDSYGTRYLGYVWYKTADHDFRLLNLELIENGYTKFTGINTDAYAYGSYMTEAEKFARSIELRIFSKLDDPLYSDKPIEMSIKDFLDNNELYYSSETESGAMIMMDAYLENLTISDSGTYTFTASQYDAETGTVYSIPVYTAYISSAASKMKIGHLYKIIGTVQYYGGKFQISGITYDSFYQSTANYQSKLEGTFILQKNYYLTFDSSTTYSDNYSDTLYSNITVKKVETENGVMTITGKANRIVDGSNGEEIEVSIKVNVSENDNKKIYIGDVLSLRGYKFDAESDIITVPSLSDITKK